MVIDLSQSIQRDDEAKEEDEFLDEKNEERRDKRRTRENVVREYTAKRDEIKAGLKVKEVELRELQNKVRFLEHSLDDQENMIEHTKANLQRYERNYKRDKFQWRDKKEKMMEIDKEVKFQRTELDRLEKRLKKAKIYGK